MRPDSMIRFIILAAALLAATVSHADWMNLTGAETAPNIAEITVEDDQVRVVLEVYIGDLGEFAALVPDDWIQDQDIKRPPLEQRLRDFSNSGLQVVTGSGEKLQAQLLRAEPRLRVDRQSPFAGMVNPSTRRMVPGAPEDKRVLYVELAYPFAGVGSGAGSGTGSEAGNQRPRQLTLIPPLNEQGRPQVSIGFITYHKSVPVIDFRYLSAASTLTLDWDDPWYSRFDNPNLKRHHKSALMSFLYVEPYEVRHEILTRVRDLENWMDLGLRNDDVIEVDELEPLKQRIGEFLLGRNPVLVDGKALKPILDRSNYVKVSLTGIQLLEKPERLEVASAIIGVIISYVTDGMPQQVTVDWDLFTDQVQRVPATATDPAGPLPGFLTPDDNVHSWTNYLKTYRMPTIQPLEVRNTIDALPVPLVSLACAAALLLVAVWTLLRARRGASLRAPLAAAALLLVLGLATWPFARIAVTRPAPLAGELDQKRATALLEALLKNTYRAFDFRDEGDVYDKLALSVSGELLTDLYLQNRRSMAIRQAGGAQAKVKEVVVEQVGAERVAGSDGELSYSLHGVWTALGSVGHWGHVHQRKNRYEAVVTVTDRDGRWKITGLDLRDEQRIDPAANNRQPVPTQ